MSSSFSLGITLSLKDKFTTCRDAMHGVSTIACQRIRGGVDRLSNKYKSAFSTAKYATLALSGATTLYAKKAINAYQDIARAQVEIKSLGIDDNGIKKITKSFSINFSNKQACFATLRAWA